MRAHIHTGARARMRTRRPRFSPRSGAEVRSGSRAADAGSPRGPRVAPRCRKESREARARGLRGGGWVTPSASKVNARRNETRVFQVGLQTATGTGTLRFTLLRDLRRCGLSAYQRCDGGVGIRGAGSFLSVWGRSNKNEGRCSGGTAHRERRRAAQTRGPRAPRPAGGTWRLSGCERVRIN